MRKHDSKIIKLGKNLGANVIPVNNLMSLFEAVIMEVQNALLSTT